MNTIFISVNVLKENSMIDYNVEDKILNTAIIDAQEIDVQPILGTSLYYKLIELIDYDTISSTTNSDYADLLNNFIIPLHIKASLLRSVMPMRVAFRNKGLMQNSSENSQPVDKEYITYVENKLKNDMEFYMNKLKGYLCDFFVKYPDYSCDIPDNRNDYLTPNRKDSYNCGIYLG